MKDVDEKVSGDVLVIGAGVCGLYAALTLARAGKRVMVLEKENKVGGLAAGFKFGENFCDFGVHMLHGFNKEIFEDCADLMGDERIEAPLDARIKWRDSTFKYPLSTRDMIESMPLFTLFRCVLGLVIAEVGRAVSPKEMDNAEDALIEYYGAPLYEYFFEGFTHKYWGIHPRALSAEFVKRKMPRLSAVDAIRKCLPKWFQSRADLVESALDSEVLHYSKTGSETLPRALATELEALGGRIYVGTEVTRIGTDVAEFEHDGRSMMWKGDHIINTAPLPVFVSLVESAPDAVKASALELKYKPSVVAAIHVRKERCMDGLYTYYRDRVFHRVGEPKNAGLVVKPAGSSILIVESTCEKGDYLWERSEKFKSEILRDLALEGICDEADVIEWNILRSAYAYPIYKLGFEKHLEAVQEWMSQQPSLATVGRQGAFTYPAMHKAMQQGRDEAENILAQ